MNRGGEDMLPGGDPGMLRPPSHPGGAEPALLPARLQDRSGDSAAS